VCVLTRTAPVYPPEARAAGVEGTVTVVAHIDSDGRVRGTEVKESVPLLDQAALDCVSHWTFRTPLFDGQPSEMEAIVPVRFRMEGGAARVARRAAHGRTAGDWDVPLPGYYSLADGGAYGAGLELHHRCRDSVWIECPKHWTSTGVFTDSTYRGTISWSPDAGNSLRSGTLTVDAGDSLHRGARGTLTVTLLPSGNLKLSSDYGPHGPPPVCATYEPCMEALRDGPSFSWSVPPPTSIRHPVWPPPDDPTARQEEHPIWPPTRSKPNADILPAAPARTDSTER